MANTQPTKYPADPFDILPEEWRPLIKASVLLDGIHWIWQKSAVDRHGNYIVRVQGRQYKVAKKLFNLVFGGDEKTKQVCGVDGCTGPLCQRAIKMTPEERYARFLTKVTKPNENGCTYYIDDKETRTVCDDDGITRAAHAYVCDYLHPETKNHPLLTHVGHECVSPLDENGRPRTNTCVTGEHVKRVTPKQNAAKKKIDGTMRSGDNHPFTKIPDAEIPKILARQGETAAALAKEYGVDISTISKIRTGRNRLGTNPHAAGRHSVQIARNGRAFPDKEDFLVAYYNLCCHHVQYSSNGCIKTDLSMCSKGYSRIKIAGRSHQVSTLIASIKNNFSLTSAVGLQGCHERHCNEKRACASFDHIRCDTPSANEEDKVSDERREKVQQIFAAFKAGISRKDIAAKFGEDLSSVYSICSGKSHSSITGVPKKIPKKIRERTAQQLRHMVSSTSTTATNSTNSESTPATVPKPVPRRCARDRLALEIIYSAQSGLTVAERAAKYSKSIQFLTELDKALAFQQTTVTQKDANASIPSVERIQVNATQKTQPADQKKEEKNKKRKESWSVNEILERAMKKRKHEAGIEEKNKKRKQSVDEILKNVMKKRKLQAGILSK